MVLLNDRHAVVALVECDHFAGILLEYLDDPLEFFDRILGAARAGASFHGIVDDEQRDLVQLDGDRHAVGEPLVGGKQSVGDVGLGKIGHVPSFEVHDEPHDSQHEHSGGDSDRLLKNGLEGGFLHSLVESEVVCFGWGPPGCLGSAHG